PAGRQGAAEGRRWRRRCRRGREEGRRDVEAGGSRAARLRARPGSAPGGDHQAPAGRGGGGAGTGLVMRAAALLLLLSTAATARADVTVRAVLQPPQLRVGQSGELSVEVQGAQNSPTPEIASIDGVTVRYVGPQTQVSIVNGKLSASITHRFAVAAARAGTFTLGPITVSVGG